METTQTKTPTIKRVLWTSFFVDLSDVLLNLIVAAITGSVVMLAEALEGLADLCSAGLLLVGFKRSKQRANHDHPFGFGKEMYYWSTLAAFVMVGITATLSFKFGYDRFTNPEPISHLWLAISVLIIAVGSNGYSLSLSIRKLLDGEPFQKFAGIFITSPHIAPKTTVVLDAMGTLAAIFGLVALTLYGLTGNAKFDGIGAMLVGALLVGFAIILLISVRSLVTGQSASREMERRIRDAVREVTEVRHVVGLRTMMLGSDNLLVNLDVHLKDGLSTDQVEEVVQKIKDAAEATGDGFTVHVEPDPEHHVGAH